jgi:hypothetical protein
MYALSAAMSFSMSLRVFVVVVVALVATLLQSQGADAIELTGLKRSKQNFHFSHFLQKIGYATHQLCN